MKVGITGHQDLGSDLTISWVRYALNEMVKKYNVTEGFTCLASGADQIYAEILRKGRIPYNAVIPSKDYEKTFTVNNHYENYKTLIADANKIIQLEFPEPNEVAFFEAGKEVVNMSSLIFAVWNGQKSKGLGGTGDIVKYALDNNKKVVHINPFSRVIKEI
jgi:hypothetical protein